MNWPVVELILTPEALNWYSDPMALNSGWLKTLKPCTRSRNATFSRIEIFRSSAVSKITPGRLPQNTGSDIAERRYRRAGRRQSEGRRVEVVVKILAEAVRIGNFFAAHARDHAG